MALSGAHVSSDFDGELKTLITQSEGLVLNPHYDSLENKGVR